MNKHAWPAAAAFLAFALFYMAPESKAEIFRPISGARYSAVAAPGANTDAITDITWSGRWGSTMYLVVQCETSTVVNVMINDGSNEIDNGINANTALVAGARYEFTIRGMVAGDVINIQSETDTVWDVIQIGFIEDK